MIRTTSLTLLILAALALPGAGCGGSDKGEAASSSDAPAPAGHFLGTAGLERGLGNAFRASLYRLAVMSQPSDGATNLGQDLPTGAVRGVSCASRDQAAAALEISTCTVRWRTVAGRPQMTRYVVHRFDTGCFSAGARPRYPDHRDPTIEGYSENPLNALVSLGSECS